MSDLVFILSVVGGATICFFVGFMVYSTMKWAGTRVSDSEAIAIESSIRERIRWEVARTEERFEKIENSQKSIIANMVAAPRVNERIDCILKRFDKIETALKKRGYEL